MNVLAALREQYAVEPNFSVLLCAPLPHPE